MNINDKPIGVFDSGVGGLSVLRELKRLLPNENFIFLADQLYLPYGEKSKKVLIERVCKITDYLMHRHDVKMMVVACNTATSYTIKELRKKYFFPIVGTIPAVKIAAQKTKSKTIAVISTPSTSKSQALHILIQNYCQDINVLNIGCKNLVEKVEEGELSGAKINTLLLKYLELVVNSDTDCLVLGCTHYPFLKKSIQKIINKKVALIDSGSAIAKQTKFLLSTYHIKNKQKKSGEVIYFTTLNPLKFSKVASLLLNNKIKAKEAKI